VRGTTRVLTAKSDSARADTRSPITPELPTITRWTRAVRASDLRPLRFDSVALDHDRVSSRRPRERLQPGGDRGHRVSSRGHCRRHVLDERGEKAAPLPAPRGKRFREGRAFYLTREKTPRERTPDWSDGQLTRWPDLRRSPARQILASVEIRISGLTPNISRKRRTAATIGERMRLR
jgi:hypothetical protein